MISIILALCVGCMNASFTVQAKWMRKKRPIFNLFNFQSDTSIAYSILFSMVSLYFVLSGQPSMTLKNLMIIFASSSLQTLCAYVG